MIMLQRTLTKARVPSASELTGLIRADGKKGDGVTLAPWNPTMVHTCAASYISPQTGVQDANWKTLKYGDIHIPSSSYSDKGHYNPSALGFILVKLGVAHLRSLVTGEKPPFLFQRLSIYIQRYNLVAFKVTFRWSLRTYHHPDNST